MPAFFKHIERQDYFEIKYAHDCEFLVLTLDDIVGDLFDNIDLKDVSIVMKDPLCSNSDNEDSRCKLEYCPKVIKEFS